MLESPGIYFWNNFKQPFPSILTMAEHNTNKYVLYPVMNTNGRPFDRFKRN